MPHRYKNGVAGKHTTTRHRSMGSHGGGGRRSDKLQQALELLNDAARDKKEELYDAIENQYSHIKDAFDEVKTTGKTMMKEAKRTAGEAIIEGEERIRKTAGKVDQKIHDKPWLFLGSIALGFFFLGYNLSRPGDKE